MRNFAGRQLTTHNHPQPLLKRRGRKIYEHRPQTFETDVSIHETFARLTSVCDLLRNVAYFVMATAMAMLYQGADPMETMMNRLLGAGVLFCFRWG